MGASWEDTPAASRIESNFHEWIELQYAAAGSTEAAAPARQTIEALVRSAISLDGLHARHPSSTRSKLFYAWITDRLARALTAAWQRSSTESTAGLAVLPTTFREARSRFPSSDAFIETCLLVSQAVLRLSCAQPDLLGSELLAGERGASLALLAQTVLDELFSLKFEQCGWLRWRRLLQKNRWWILLFLSKSEASVLQQFGEAVTRALKRTPGQSWGALTLLLRTLLPSRSRTCTKMTQTDCRARAGRIAPGSIAALQQLLEYHVLPVLPRALCSESLAVQRAAVRVVRLSTTIAAHSGAGAESKPFTWHAVLLEQLQSTHGARAQPVICALRALTLANSAGTDAGLAATCAADAMNALLGWLAAETDPPTRVVAVRCLASYVAVASSRALIDAAQRRKLEHAYSDAFGMRQQLDSAPEFPTAPYIAAELLAWARMDLDLRHRRLRSTNASESPTTRPKETRTAATGAVAAPCSEEYKERTRKLQKQPLLAVCAYASSIESEADRLTVIEPTELAEMLTLLQHVQRTLAPDDGMAILTGGSRIGAAALATCPVDACDACDVARTCVIAARMLYRWCVRSVTTPALLQAFANVWLAFSTLDLRVFTPKNVTADTHAAPVENSKENWLHVREVARLARLELRATDRVDVAEARWSALRSKFVPSLLDRLEQISIAVPRYAEYTNAAGVSYWPVYSTRRGWLRGFRKRFAALIASMPLDVQSPNAIASALMFMVHPLATRQARRRYEAFTQWHMPEAPLSTLLREMSSVADTLGRAPHTAIAEFSIDALGLLRASIRTWGWLLIEIGLKHFPDLSSLATNVFETFVLPALTEIWRESWTADDLRLVHDAMPSPPQPPQEPVRKPPRDRNPADGISSNRTKQEQQAERDRYQTAMIRYEELLSIYREKERRREHLLQQQRALHDALAGIWAGWCEMLTMLRSSEFGSELCDLFLLSMEVLHRVTKHLDRNRAREVWMALLRSVQRLVHSSPMAAEDSAQNARQRMLAAVLSVPLHADAVVEHHALSCGIPALPRYPLDFIRGALPIVLGSMQSTLRTTENQVLTLAPWLFLAESIALEPRTSRAALPVLLPLYKLVTDEIDHGPMNDLLVSCVWRSFGLTVLLCFLTGQCGLESVETETREDLESMLWKQSRCWRRAMRSDRASAEDRCAASPRTAFEPLPPEIESRLLAELRGLPGPAGASPPSDDDDDDPIAAAETSASFCRWRDVLCRALPFPWSSQGLLIHRSILELLPGVLGTNASVRSVCVFLAEQIPAEWRRHSLAWRLTLTLASHDRVQEVAWKAQQLLEQPIHDVSMLAPWLEHPHAFLRQAAADGIADSVVRAADPLALLRQWLPVWFARFPKPVSIDPRASPGAPRKRPEQVMHASEQFFGEGLSQVLIALATRDERPVSADLLPMIFTFLCARGWLHLAASVRQRLRQAAICFIEQHGSVAVPTLLAFLSSALENPPADLEITLQDLRQENIVIALGMLALHIPSHEPALLGDVGARLARVALATPAADVQQAAADVLARLIPKWMIIDDATVRERIESWFECALSSGSYGERRGAALLWAAAQSATTGAAAPAAPAAPAATSWSGSLPAQRIRRILADRDAPLEARLGALTLLEALAMRLESAYEPIGVEMLPLLLQASGDTMTSVRQASADASRAFMRHLSKARMSAVLDSLIGQLDQTGAAWRTRMAALDMLGSMADMGPEQLSQALPEIVPRLVTALTDVHPRVQETASLALSRMAELAMQVPAEELETENDNAKLQQALARSLSKRLVQALSHPEQYLLPVLHELRRELQRTLMLSGIRGGGSSASVLLLDALLLPLLRRALSHRQLSVREGGLDVLLERMRTSDRCAGYRGSKAYDALSFSWTLAQLEQDVVSVILRDPSPEQRHRAALALRERKQVSYLTPFYQG